VEEINMDRKKILIRKNSIWHPIRLGTDHLIRSRTIRPLFIPVPLWRNNNIGSVSKRNLTWPQAQVRYPRMDPFGDADRDGKLNMFDCRPFDMKRHGDPNISFGDRIDTRPSKPEKSEAEQSKIIKAVIFKRNWQEFNAGKRSGKIKESESFPSWVSEKYEKKAEVEEKRISDTEKARELGLLDEE
jgi:hypothetical protein